MTTMTAAAAAAAAAAAMSTIQLSMTSRCHPGRCSGGSGGTLRAHGARLCVRAVVVLRA